MSVEDQNSGVEANESIDMPQELEALKESILDNLNSVTTQDGIRHVFTAAAKQAGEIQQRIAAENPEQDLVRVELSFDGLEPIELSDLETKVKDLYGAIKGGDSSEITMLSEGVASEVVEILQDLSKAENAALEAHWESQ